MSKNLIRHAALLVAAVLLSAHFWSCSKEDVPEPTPPVVSVTSVTLNKTSTSIQVGGTETLTATVLPEDATNQNVTWKSDKPEIATVDANGKVTGVKAGEATITVTTEDGGKTATCKVTVPEPEINRFVLFGKTYPAFTVFVSKEVLGKGNYDIYVYPAEDNTIELGLQCSMQHDGMSLDLTKYDPLNAVPGYSGWMWYISVEKTEEGKTEEGKEEYLLEGWGGDAPTMGILGLAGDILYIKSLNSDHTQFEIRCKFTDPLKGSLDFYYKGAVELFE